MTVDDRRSFAARYEYLIVKAKSHDQLTERLAPLARDGWEPVNAYAWNTDMNHADHACLLRRVVGRW